LGSSLISACVNKGEKFPHSQCHKGTQGEKYSEKGKKLPIPPKVEKICIHLREIALVQGGVAFEVFC